MVYSGKWVAPGGEPTLSTLLPVCTQPDVTIIIMVMVQGMVVVLTTLQFGKHKSLPSNEATLIEAVPSHTPDVLERNSFEVNGHDVESQSLCGRDVSRNNLCFDQFLCVCLLVREQKTKHLNNM